MPSTVTESPIQRNRHERRLAWLVFALLLALTGLLRIVWVQFPATSTLPTPATEQHE